MFQQERSEERERPEHIDFLCNDLRSSSIQIIRFQQYEHQSDAILLQRFRFKFMADKNTHIQAIIHQNKLLADRNHLLQLQNQALLDEIELIKTETQRARLTKMDNKPTQRRQRDIRQDYQQLVLLRVEKQQAWSIYREKVPFLKSKLSQIKDSQLSDHIELFTDVQQSNSYIGMLRLLYNIVDQCLDGHHELERRTKQLSDRQNNLRITQSMQLRQRQQQSRLVLVKDPEFIVQQCQWISKFEDEFNIIKNFYEKLIKQITKHEQNTHKKHVIHNILMLYEKMEFKKLELYRLAIRIQNEQRDYKLKSSRNESMESLRLSTNKLLDNLCEQQEEIKSMRSGINDLIQQL